MGLFINITLLFVAFIALAIASGYLTNATIRTTGIPEYNSGNSDLSLAHKYGTIGSIVAWISVAIILLAIVIYFIYGAETFEATGNLFIYGLLFFILALTITVGVLAALSAYYVNKSGVPNNNGSYRNFIISAVIAIPVFVIILILFLIKIFYHPK